MDRDKKPDWTARRRRLLLAAAVGLGLGALAAPRPAAAEERPWARGVSAEHQTRALGLFKAGNGFLAEGRIAPALAEYRKAVALWDHPTIRYNMVICLVRLGRSVEAHRSLQRALRFGKAPLGDRHAQALDYQRLLLGQLGWLTVECVTAGAQVSLDGKPLLTGAGKKKRLLPLGRHEVVTSKRGHVTDKRRVLVLPGKTRTVRIKLLTLASQVRIKRRMARFIPWLTFSVGVAALAGGISLNVMGRADATSYDEQVLEHCSGYPSGGCTPDQIPGSLTELRTRAERMIYSSYALSAVGGALTATGIVLLILNRGRKVEAASSAWKTARTLRPVLLPGGLGLSFSRSF